ncbi:hypothetical protein G9A89_015024 [Geosiphon pyriformis]|nr:hypothetical protein G9A89_015024 [Geosiphon pyriformis]
MHWKRLDLCGPVPKWFKLSVTFFNGVDFFFALPSLLHDIGPLNILESSNFLSVSNYFSWAGASSLSVYMDESLNNLGTASCRAGTAAYFEDIGLGLGVSVSGLMSFTLAEFQSALDVCKSELDLMCLDFHNQCWVECYHIVNIIHGKNLNISWHKVKGHSGIMGNKCTDVIAGAASLFNWYLPLRLDKHFLIADGRIVSVLYKGFVFDGWFCETVSVFCDLKVASLKVVEFVHSFGLAFRTDVWSVCAKYCAYMKKNGLIPLDGSALISVSGLVLGFSASVVKLLSITDDFGICFGFHKSSLFFSGLDNLVSVYIAA